MCLFAGPLEEALHFGAVLGFPFYILKRFPLALPVLPVQAFTLSRIELELFLSIPVNSC